VIRRLVAAAALLTGLLALPAPAEAVVGGQVVRPSAYPWFATLSGCGGSLVAPDRVVTAAHCVAGLELGELGGVRLGDGRRRAVARVAVEPGYVRRVRSGVRSSAAPADDVALLQLTEPAQGIAPVPLASVARTGSRARVLGRGLSRAPRRVVGSSAAAGAAQAGDPPLRAATLRVLSDRSCASFYRRRGGRLYRGAFRGAGMLCAGDPRFRRPAASACSRDSGGPLAVRRGSGWALLGVVSWGLRCGADGDPTVFADAVRYRAFVTDPDPVWAPVAGDQPATVSGDPRPGATLTCTAPPFASAPSEIVYRWTSYRFQRGNLVRRQSPSPSYRVRGDDAGRLVICTAVGFTAGGFAESRPSAGARISGS
jgi:Trypsin